MADAHGFVALCPDASKTHLCSGAPCWDHYGTSTNLDDAGFLNAVAQTAAVGLGQQSKAPDPRKLFMYGFSNGTEALIMAANEYGDFFAGAVPYESSFYDFEPVSTPGQTPSVPAQNWPISVLFIRNNGACTNYQNCGYAQCGVVKYGPQHNSFSSGMNEFFYHFADMPNPNPYACTPAVGGPMTIGAGIAKCTGADTTQDICTVTPQTSLPTVYAQTSPDVMEKSTTGCDYGVEVQMLKLMGSGHTWWGNTQFSNSNCTATSNPPCNTYLNSTTGLTMHDILWNFFAAHPKQ
jgi:poly(3-hydroxybutyrate) depolymerase